MKDTEFCVSLTVKEAYDLLRSSDFADIVDQEYKDLGNNKYLGIIIFEKYFIRVKNRVSLVVIIDNTPMDTQ